MVRDILSALLLIIFIYQSEAAARWATEEDSNYIEESNITEFFVQKSGKYSKTETSQIKITKEAGRELRDNSVMK